MDGIAPAPLATGDEDDMGTTIISIGECQCTDWAITDPQAAMLGNGHNPTCEHFIPAVRAVQLLEKLTTGIKWWADQEDGVRESGRWRACVTLKKKRFWLGEFDNETDAARAYDAKASELHGEHARLNFPKGGGA